MTFIKQAMQRNMNPVSAYYRHTGGNRMAAALGLKAREKMYEIFIEKIKPSAETKILDVGVTCDRDNTSSNYFEQFYPYKKHITCVGTEDAFWLEGQYPGLKFHKIEPHSKLPFEDGQFDVAFSNAVIEHVGSSAAQQKFISELLRVSKAFFITTPNRWFPIETHTMLVLIHYLPVKWWRKCLGLLGYEYYSHESNLNLLDKKTLTQLFPTNEPIEVIEVRTLGFVSNIVVLKKL